jgi:tRNA-modifying protein YgfZ
MPLSFLTVTEPMNPQWQTFLEQHGARIVDAAVTDFGDPSGELHSVEDNRVLCDLSHYALLDIQGEDAAGFMQGQFCNDVREVTDERSQLSGHCTPKGRLLASFRLFRHTGHYYLRLPAALRDTLGKRLRMYVLRAKVSIAAAPESWTGFGYAGPGADQALHAALGAAPAQTDAVIAANGAIVLRVPGPQPRFEIYGDTAVLQELWNALANGARHVGAGVWSLLDIRSGLATLLPQTTEAFVPQMVNLQQVGGVSFTKGCYPGQEVVARMQYLGKLKRRMYRAHIATDSAPQPGESLYTAHVETGQDAGMIVDAQAAPQGGYEVLAVVQCADVELGDVRLEGPQGAVLNFLDLPYSPDSAAQQQA